MKKYFYLFIFIFAQIEAFSYLSFPFSFPQYEERWSWDIIDITNVSFPKNFLWGTADSAFQTEGVITANGKQIQNSWTVWEEKRNVPLEKRAGNACERWTYYKEDVQRMKDLGFTVHRFSIEWSKIEPERGIFDYEAMQHYIDYIRAMIDNGIQPIPTLFHHTWPLWFEYPDEVKAGMRRPAFEDARNCADFVEFALFVMHSLEQAGMLKDVRIWLTFNEPISFSLAAYVDGSLPPGKKLDFKTAGIVAKNMLDTHIAIYEAFKKIDANLKISFAHVITPFHPYNPWNPFEYVATKFVDYLMNDSALEYFKTGDFYWFNNTISLRNLITGNFKQSIFTKVHNPNACNKLDFIGLNYYSHSVLKMVTRDGLKIGWFKQQARPFEKVADGYEAKKVKSIYAEGFYEVIKRVAYLGIPILITENGFAAKTDALRDEYIKKHLYALYKALSEGIDIRGYLFWTLTDCFGWDSGHHSHHGIYAVDFATQERTFKKNAQYYIDVINGCSSAPEIEPLCTTKKIIVAS